MPHRFTSTLENLKFCYSCFAYRDQYADKILYISGNTCREPAIDTCKGSSVPYVQILERPKNRNIFYRAYTRLVKAGKQRLPYLMIRAGGNRLI